MPEVRIFASSEALIERGMEALVQAVTESAETMAADAQDRAPVDTGTLRASIHVEGVQRSGLEVKATVATGGEASDYAVFQELGTTKMAAQPFMGPAAINHEPLHQKVCEAAWNGAF
jgi:HK97 gp10 family phage protein